MHPHGMFIDDLAGADCAYGITVRSPIARGSIQKIEIPDLPPGYWSVKAAEIPGDPSLRCSGSDMPFLAGTQVRYPGEPLLLLAGPDRETLAELARGVEIRCREAEAVTSLAGLDSDRLKPELHLRRGDPDQAFQDSYQIVEGTYTLAAQNPPGQVPRGAFAFTEDKTLTVWAAVLDPFYLRDQIASLLALPPRRVRVKVPRVRYPRAEQALCAVLAAGHAALLSHAGGCAVKLFADFGEESCRFPPGSRCRIRQSTALDRDGNPLGLRLEIILDAGAYRTCTPGVLREAVLAVCGIYRYENIDVVGKLAYTNTLPVGLSSVTAQSAAAFATELQQTRLAEISQLDPYVWKRAQLQARLPAAAAVLDEATSRADFRRKHAAYAALNTRRKDYLAPPHPLRGVGISLCVQSETGEWGFSLPADGASPRVCSVKVRLEPGRRLSIASSIVETGQQRDRLFAASAAAILELAPERIRLEPVDTFVVPDSGYSSLAGTFEINRLIEKCCRALRSRNSGGSLPLEVRRSFRVAPEIDPRREKTLEPPRGAASWAATVVEVEVDAETLQPCCRQIVMVVEAGAVRDPDFARMQLEAGILSALKRTTWGGRDAVPVTAEAVCEPAAGQAPSLSVRFLQASGRDHDGRAFDALPDLGVAAAYVSAVSQATGLYIDEIPLTAEVIQRCLLAAAR
jgi:CO/xanthine dehydrogenase Mo-binding subunit